MIRTLLEERTDCYRVFHGSVEGRPGLSLDRYGPLWLAQTSRTPLDPQELGELRQFAGSLLVYNDRQAKEQPVPESPEALKPVLCRELGLAYRIRARHRGQDPHLFLDLRAARRWIRSRAAGQSVLNLFAYTCGVGLCALAGGAREVWNVDDSRRHLEIGLENLALNELPEAIFRCIQEDVYPVLWQLAGLPVKGKAARRRRYVRLPPRQFDLVVVDPPPFAAGPYGAVDLVRDYQSLFKPCLRVASEGGIIVAANNSPDRQLEEFQELLERCASKAGRPLLRQEVIPVDADFPSWDGRHPLKVVACWCR
ncbi:MAG: class I SAM-dependent rRNA methyltransferase [Armatimonadetes bacterium]|nr:class I SAM-dependent rRNA methyltransferase [Armatimonadota bacterium]